MIYNFISVKNIIYNNKPIYNIKPIINNNIFNLFRYKNNNIPVNIGGIITIIKKIIIDFK